MLLEIIDCHHGSAVILEEKQKFIEKQLFSPVFGSIFLGFFNAILQEN
jgi:hypothetical protein